MRKFTIESELIVGKLYYLLEFTEVSSPEIVDNSVGEYIGCWNGAHFFAVRFIEDKNSWCNYYDCKLNGPTVWFDNNEILDYELVYFEDV